MPLKSLQEIYLPEIEQALKDAIGLIDKNMYPDLSTMMAYHLGWEGQNVGPEATGKRIRPILVLLTCSAAGGNWKLALPAAVSVELIHNFSLLHDDIEDHSPLRRGRPTVWMEWGIPQAINTGDAMLSLAHLILLDLERKIPKKTVLESAKILQKTCLALTQGQHLDISYEDREDLHINDYWLMIGGKTAALLGACTELGALAAGISRSKQQHYRTFGLNLGLAFQVLDDLLGIWGDEAKIGKSNASDLVSGKKTLPVLYGLEKSQDFAARWRQGSITPEDVPRLAWQLETEGARTYTQVKANQLTDKALDAFTAAQPQGDAGEALRELANRLLQREQ